MTPIHLAILVAVGFATAAVGVVTGGNSLVTVPVMMALGMSPRAAIATNMAALTCMTVAATARFARARMIAWRRVIQLGALTVVASLVGARLTVALSAQVLTMIVTASMVAVVLFMLLRPGFGQEGRAVGRRRRVLGFVAAGLLGVYGGLFSGGYTTLLTFVCVELLGESLLAAVALTKVVNLLSSAVATAVFAAAGTIDWRVGLPLGAAMLIGGWVGAHTVVRGGHRLARGAFVVVVSGLALKLLVDLFR